MMKVFCGTRQYGLFVCMDRITKAEPSSLLRNWYRMRLVSTPTEVHVESGHSAPCAGSVPGATPAQCMNEFAKLKR